VQRDLHHAGTYVVARLAGFSHNEASTVAHAAQYVDDSTNRGTVRFDNGASYERIASAHKTFDVVHNSENKEDYEVWVPFHFLPGNNGEAAGAGKQAPLHQRLVCTPDSPTTVDMWNQCRARRADANALHRLGITAHVYCDTFSHQMFVGIRHRINRVAHLEHLNPRESSVMARIESMVADELELGHGGALTDPDLPYLEWRYVNGSGQDRTVSNPELYLTALDRLFSQFLYYLGRDRDLTIPAADRALLEQLIRTTGGEDPVKRNHRWLEQIRSGGFSFGALNEDESPSLEYVPSGAGSWRDAALGMTEERDKPGRVFHYDERFEQSDWKKFHDALKEHQATVLKGILPDYGLPDSYAAAKERGL
jgi:hypothetical protein